MGCADRSFSQTSVSRQGVLLSGLDNSLAGKNADAGQSAPLGQRNENAD